MKLVQAWIELHQDDLMADWHLASTGQTPFKIGYDNSNVITMFKTGSTKLPLNTVGPIARALGVDPVYLLRLTFREYYPETFDAVERCLQTTILTANERMLIDAFRRATPDCDPEVFVFDDKKMVALVLADH